MRKVLMLIAVVVAGVVVSADTLILRDGTRVTGRLVGANDDTVEFEERGSGRRAVVRSYDRDEILRIEFDRAPGGGFFDEPARPARPSGLRERLVIVSGDVDWNDAGMTLRANQDIWLESSGRVQWGRDRRHGPAGEPNSPRNDGRPMPSRNAAALIGKIGEQSTDYFFLGNETGPIRIHTAGRLFLGVNDDFLNDNSGNFRVVVYY